jgi:uncharacterized protein YecE (DUF72 family)
MFKNGDVIYFPFHDIPGLYMSAFSEQPLRAFVDEIETSENIKEAFIDFNNDIEGSAIHNVSFHALQ